MKSDLKHRQLNEAKWARWADSLDKRGFRKSYLRTAQRELISLLEVKENISFLDVGCGTGWALGQIAVLARGKSRFYGVDLSPEMIAKARENFKGLDSFHFVIASAEEMPLESDFFDVIICTNSFHHYFNPAKALREIRRLLRPGGKVYILDPTADQWLIRQADKLIRILEPAHVKMYSSREFQELFGGAGLTYSETKAINWHEKIHIAEKPKYLL
jgi:ubiquinone/menaquinone biosynthesis C-methylase UbiE